MMLSRISFVFYCYCWGIQTVHSETQLTPSLLLQEVGEALIAIAIANNNNNNHQAENSSNTLRDHLQLEAVVRLYVLHGSPKHSPSTQNEEELSRINVLSDIAQQTSSLKVRCNLYKAIVDLAIVLEHPAWIPFANFAACPSNVATFETDWLLRAIQANPAQGGLWYNLGLAIEKCGKACEAISNAVHESFSFDPAISTYEAAWTTSIQLSPCLEQPRFAIADRLVKQGNISSAHQHFDALLECNRRSDPHKYLVVRMRKLSAILPVVYASQTEMDQELNKFLSDLADLLSQATVLCSSTGNGCAGKDPMLTCGFGSFGYYIAYHGTGIRDHWHINYTARKMMASTYRILFPDLLGNASLLKLRNPELQLPVGTSIECKYKVGFLSAFLHNHSVGKLLRGPIQLVSSMEGICTYVIQITHPNTKHDSISDSIFQSAYQVIQVPNTSLNQARETISDLDLDLLVYGEVGMDTFTYFLAFQRLAEKVAVFWGHGLTTGIQGGAIDYYISSRNFHLDTAHGVQLCDRSITQVDSKCATLPQSGNAPLVTKEAQLYTEPNVYLMQGLTTFVNWVNDLDSSQAARRSARQQLSILVQKFSKENSGSIIDSLPEVAHIYLVPQTLRKLTPTFDHLLHNILDADTNGHVVLICDAVQNYHVVLRRFRSVFSTDILRRVHFIESVEHATFLQIAHGADVVLDPVPYGGGVTSMEVLLTGTPIVYYPTATTVIAITHALYLEMDNNPATWSCCIATSDEEYVAKATRLAVDSAWNSKVRSTILQKRNALSSPSQVKSDWKLFFHDVLSYEAAL